jgi:hypothetical protein
MSIFNFFFKKKKPFIEKRWLFVDQQVEILHYLHLGCLVLVRNLITGEIFTENTLNLRVENSMGEDIVVVRREIG